MGLMRNGALAGLTATISGCAVVPPTVEPPPAVASVPVLSPQSQCGSLAGFSLPGYVINVAKAAEIAATTTTPAHCLVEGEINPRVGAGGKPYALGFALALPEPWSGRFMFQGGGGYNGVVRPPHSPQTGGASALARGFAVVSTDSGHKGNNTDFLADQQATLDFAQDSIGTVSEVGKKLVEAYYRRAPHHSYFSGCSNGGREAMVAAQRYPHVFDGVIASDPGMRSENTRIASAWAMTVFNRAAPKDASGMPQLGRLYTEADRKLVLSSLLNQCDELDGLMDGLIFNTAQCRFDPAALTCKGAKSDSCLTRPQAEAIKTAVAGPMTRGGLPFYAPYPYDTSILTTKFMPSAPLASVSQPTNAAATAMELDVDKAWSDVAADGAWVLAASAPWTNYSTFFGRGGKLILTNGMSDPAFSAHDTAAYYQRLLRDNGGASTARQSSRLFLIPGRGHCGGGGVTLAQFDTLAAIVDWVEQGRAPDAIAATVSNAPEAKRPLCAWPTYAHYNGTGDPKDGASFTCRQ